MKHVGDLKLARERYFKKPTNNLYILLKNRYAWMNQYTDKKKQIIELGSGAGFSKEFICNPNLTLTDIAPQPWIHQVVDAMNMPYADNSLDVLICNHMIHHLSHPKKFFLEAARTLKPGGLILISELHTSWLMRLSLLLMRHEGWSYEVNPFQEQAILEDPDNPWTANCAIPDMLFSNEKIFTTEIPQLEFKKNELGVCFSLFLSGGVIARAKTIELPMWFLKLVSFVDKQLTNALPSFFAMERFVVLKKII